MLQEARAAAPPPPVFAPGRALGRYAWAVLAYNVAVVLWGAYVRATGSGAGCGNHWPDCNGAVIPTTDQAKTLIEFTHRASVGVGMVGVLALLVWTFLASRRGEPIRLGAVAAVLFTV